MTQSDTRRGVRLPPDRPEAWKPHPRFSYYEVSDKGRHRSVDRVVNGRRYQGKVLATRIHDGYVLMDFRDNDGRKVTCNAQVAVLETFEGKCPPGMESLHGEYGPLVNWWPENLRRGSKAENQADKGEDAQAPAPTFDCLDRCGAKVTREDRRCRDCVARVGRRAARMLAAGMNLEVVTVRCGYASSDWVYKLAAEFGGYDVTKRDARLQRPTLTQRVRITVRDRQRDGWGDAA